MLVKLFILFFIILICYQLFFLQPIIEGLTQEESLKDHDEIIRIQSELNNVYRPLITNSEGKPVNLLSRVTALETEVAVIKNQMIKTSQSHVNAVPPAPKVEPLPAGN